MRSARPIVDARRVAHAGGRLAAGVLVSFAVSCAPLPTAIERYCDVVHQSQAAFDPFTTPGAVTDPTVLRKALSDQIATATALGDAAPDAMRADASTVKAAFSRIANLLAAENYDVSKLDADPAFAALVGDTGFQDARRRLEIFNGNRCA